jgi:hypothetical protein
MTIKLHLIKSGFGMATKSACGRNVIGMHMAAKWNEFKNSSEKCEKCESSKQAELNARKDGWEPEEYSHATDLAKYPKLAQKQQGSLLR